MRSAIAWLLLLSIVAPSFAADPSALPPAAEEEIDEDAFAKMLVRVQVVEFSHTALRERGLDVRVKIGKSHGCGFSELLAALQRDHLLKEITAPSIAVLEGCPASIFVGGEIAADGQEPSKAGKLTFGTRLELMAARIDAQNVRLQLQCEIGELAPAAEGQPAMVRKFTLNTTVEMPFGETTALGGSLKRRSVSRATDVQADETAPAQEIERLVLVTVERLGSEISQTQE